MKGIKFLAALAAASLFFSVSVFAQENANRDANGNVVRGPYETNALGDNLFVGGGIGINTGWNFGNTGILPFVTMPGLGLDAYVGKWLTPEWGARLIYHGINTQVIGNPIDFNRLFTHYFGLDVMADFSSLIDGYQETRDWSWIGYVTAGAHLADVLGDGFRFNPGWALGIGGIAKKYAFLGNENLDMVIDARILALSDGDLAIGGADRAWNEKKGDGSFLGKLGYISFPLSATWGVAYKFGKQGFKRSASIVPAVVPVPFTAQQYEDLSGKVAELEKENAALKDKIAALEKDNEDLRNKLASGQNYVYEEGKFVAVDSAAGSKTTLYFDCGSATLSAREKAHFEYFADAVKAETKLKVDGYADKQTGSAKRNQQLSEQRVKAVVDLLKKAGASEANIESAAHGASVQPFDSAAKNRVVTVEILK